MTNEHEILLAIIVVAAVLGSTYGWFSNKSKKLKEDEFNRDLRKRLEDERRAVELRGNYIAELRRQFDVGFLTGRRWLAKFVAEADRALDESIADHLRYKNRPALKAAEEITEARAERRRHKERSKFLEYQLQSLKEYFPFLEEYEEIILDEGVTFVADASNIGALEQADPVLRFVSNVDYKRLSSAERNQIALDRYLSGSLSAASVGRLYERYIGSLYENDGWKVDYHGIVKGFEDLGRDLICSRGAEVKIIQAKCWSTEKTIHEKHIFQLFGTTQLYLMGRRVDESEVSALFVTSTSLSPVAREAAEWLKIEVKERHSLSKSFPMIKCNINQGSKEKIYHLPFDQQYDRTRIVADLGEFYAATVAQAEKAGFRRAFRFSGNSV